MACFDPNRPSSFPWNPRRQNLSHRPECAVMLPRRAGCVWLRKQRFRSPSVTLFGNSSRQNRLNVKATMSHDEAGLKN
jgi:hypothetical protein